MRCQGFRAGTAAGTGGKALFQRNTVRTLNILVGEKEQRGFVRGVAFKIMMLRNHVGDFWIAEGADPGGTGFGVPGLGARDVVQQGGGIQQ